MGCKELVDLPKSAIELLSPVDKLSNLRAHFQAAEPKRIQASESCSPSLPSIHVNIKSTGVHHIAQIDGLFTKLLESPTKKSVNR
jgi:hypothetical protein